MKSTSFCKFLVILFGCSCALIPGPVHAFEKVLFKENKLWVWQDGVMAEAASAVVLPFSIVVETNGMFRVKNGKERELREGEVLARDGMLIKPEGSIMPVMDHISMNRGHVLVTKDGETTELNGTAQLGDGTTVSPDGNITRRDGSSRRLLDGELFQFEGSALPARDTITMQDGRVMVQKDGTMLVVSPARSIMMNDGTKVLGDGTVIDFNGRQTKLSKGQILVVEGVVRKR